MPEFSTMLDLQAQMMLLLAIGIFLAKEKLMVIMLTQWQLPTFLGKAVQCTSSCNMTMSMFLIGAIIGSRDLHPLLDKDAIIYCIIRLFLMPLVVLVV